MNTTTYSNGDYIFKEGDESDLAYFIVDGEVEVVVNSPRGEKVIAELGEGRFFGEMGVIIEEPRTASIRAKGKVTVEAFGIGEFESDILGNRERREPYLISLFENLRSLTGQIKSGSLSQMQTYAFEATHSSSRGEAGAEADATSTVRLQSLEPLEEGDDCIDVVLKKFPFNIGRASESRLVVENDFYVDDERPYQVSRGHCSIERRGGQWVVRDRFSSGGTIVNNTPIGSQADSFVAVLKPGVNDLILGSKESRFKFTVTLS